ncbi:hypothetical protein C4J84_1429 [Pseudomonas sp. R11-23-07]|nr:hypothetical protein C4J86_1560 [Pseudomonas sp. R2-7-07]AZF57320.1 hypothetical protein C4J84_1429 [Pseudomonas sp. R11-23-07]
MTWHKHQSSMEMAVLDVAQPPGCGGRQNQINRSELFKPILACSMDKEWQAPTGNGLST